jgi:hypothetical protein
MFEKGGGAGAETPWGQPWVEVLAELRPTAAEGSRLRGVMRRVEDALAVAGVSGARVVAGGEFGKGTAARGAPARLELYAVFDDGFAAADYFDSCLKLLFDAVQAAKGGEFVNVEDRGLAVEFTSDGVECRLFGAGVLYGGVKDLLLDGARREAGGAPNGGGAAVDPREVHTETTCGVLRAELIRAQCPLYKDMVRVAKKWRDGCKFMVAGGSPGDYLIELLMLEAFHGAPAAPLSPDLYSAVFRRFLALVATQSGTGSDAIAADAMPRTFLTWTTYYNRATVDYCLAKGLLAIDNRSATLDGSALVVVDPAVPFVNVAATVTEWSELRAAARDSLASFQATEMVEILDVRLQNFSEKVGKTLTALTSKLETLEEVERSPRRWTGTLQFRDVHMSSDAWASVVEMELRCLKWILHARRPRSDSTGYNQMVDISLQVVGSVPRQLDVDVSFRGAVTQLKFDSETDHVLVARRSEVMRNRDYTLQVTVC